MISIDFNALSAFLQSNWGWVTGLAASIAGVTALAATILNQDRKETIALWLMGAQPEETWARSFTAMRSLARGICRSGASCAPRSPRFLRWC